MSKKLTFLGIFMVLMICFIGVRTVVGQETMITKWQDGKKGAVSITYDDGIRNQFKFAVPIMNELHLPATFFIITGFIKGSRYHGKFIGRPVDEIIQETSHTSTDSTNFFERASASLHLGYKDALAYYDSCADLYDSYQSSGDGPGKRERAEAYHLMDRFYRKVREGKLKPGKDTSMEMSNELGLTWDSVREYALEGYEFASHTITHAHLSIMDTTNMVYELRKSKEEIREQLGDKYTFSAEVPFGIENGRVMKHALKIYPALRNSIVEPYMDEINRGVETQPDSLDNTYVQWQRGALTTTSPALMKSWIDTTSARDNIWLVLVFHGIDGMGWEPLTHQSIKAYFEYIKAHENKLWVASFGNVARYMRERMNTKVDPVKIDNNKIIVTLDMNDGLDKSMYNIPLTLQTYVPSNWRRAEVRQGILFHHLVNTQKDKKGTYLQYQSFPGAGAVALTRK